VRRALTAHLHFAYDHLMDMQTYLKNRIAFPADELARHRGEWIAWSPDGTHIVAASRHLDGLDALVRAAGAEPEECPIEGIPDTDCIVGGMDVA
jgi:hypothetical protein